MKNIQSRVSNFGNVLFNMTLGLLFAVFVLSYIQGLPDVAADMQVVRYNHKNHIKSLIFRPNVDFSQQFKFNTKQIFVYAVLQGSGKSEMVWSKIVRRGDAYALFDKQYSNYTFAGSNDNAARFELRGNVYPYVGQMKDVHYGFLDLKFD
ncbi:signal peptidase complex subunit 3 [Pancytospora philotis]|nr:signal peptidase complex subunit 3 [Pancytospora philotis]